MQVQLTLEPHGSELREYLYSDNFPNWRVQFKGQLCVVQGSALWLGICKCRGLTGLYKDFRLLWRSVPLTPLCPRVNCTLKDVKPCLVWYLNLRRWWERFIKKLNDVPSLLTWFSKAVFPNDNIYQALWPVWDCPRHGITSFWSLRNP